MYWQISINIKKLGPSLAVAVSDEAIDLKASLMPILHAIALMLVGCQVDIMPIVVHINSIASQIQYSAACCAKINLSR